MNNLGFITLGNSVKKMGKVFEEVAKTVLQQDRLNIVIYNIIKTEAILFSKSHCQQSSKQIHKTKVKVCDKPIMFNKKET